MSEHQNWRELVDQKKWSSIAPSILSKDELLALRIILEQEVPKREYGEGLAFFEDYIEPHHAKNIEEYRTADLLRSVRDHLSVPERVSEQPIKKLVLLSVKVKLEELGFWLPTAYSIRDLLENLFLTNSSGAKFKQFPTVIALRVLFASDSISWLGRGPVASEIKNWENDPCLKEAKWQDREVHLKQLEAIGTAFRAHEEAGEMLTTEMLETFVNWSRENHWCSFISLGRAKQDRYLEPNSDLALIGEVLEALDRFETLVSSSQEHEPRGNGLHSVSGVAFEIGRILERLEFKPHEFDAVRGKKVKRGAVLGGSNTSSQKSKLSQTIVEQMKDLIEIDGHSASRAASLVFSSRNLGTSPEANRKLWTRHARKLGQ